MRDSNSRHAVLETAALPTELIPFYLALFLPSGGAPASVGAPLRGFGITSSGGSTGLIFR